MPEPTWRDRLQGWLGWITFEKISLLINLERQLRVLESAFQLTNTVDEKIVREVLKAHAELKRSYEDQTR